MSYIEIDDDDDDLVVDTKPQEKTKKEQAREVIKHGIEDTKKIVSLLEEIEQYIEPFGELETILELKTLYSEVIPDILLGNYDNITDVMSEEAKEITMVMVKQRRKAMFDKLAKKYN